MPNWTKTPQKNFNKLKSWITSGNPQCKFSASDWQHILEWQRLGLDAPEKRTVSQRNEYDGLVRKWRWYYEQVQETMACKRFRAQLQAFKKNDIATVKNLAEHAKRNPDNTLKSPSKYDPEWLKQSWPVLRYKTIVAALSSGDNDDEMYNEGKSIFGVTS